MASTEAMRLFVKILEEEVPGWYSRTTGNNADPGVDVDVDVQVNHNSITQPGAENGNGIPETKAISSESDNQLETQDKDMVSEGLGSVGAYDEWITPPISGPRPRSRYEHGATVVQEKIYIVGGNHNGRYLSDLQVLDLRTWTWSKIEAKGTVDLSDSSSPTSLSPCAGHSLIHWENKLLSVAGHTKDPSESIQVKVFDLQTLTWSTLKTYGKAPVSRGGQSITLVGATLVIVGALASLANRAIKPSNCRPPPFFGALASLASRVLALSNE
uniref:ACB domain-containing protein n=1 Tax=Kalanchoe fedtschenkoi TaxID=63787 RepID=A0A7N0THX1_KALFE